MTKIIWNDIFKQANNTNVTVTLQKKQKKKGNYLVGPWEEEKSLRSSVSPLTAILKIGGVSPLFLKLPESLSGLIEKLRMPFLLCRITFSSLNRKCRAACGVYKNFAIGYMDLWQKQNHRAQFSPLIATLLCFLLYK